MINNTYHVREDLSFSINMRSIKARVNKGGIKLIAVDMPMTTRVNITHLKNGLTRGQIRLNSSLVDVFVVLPSSAYKNEPQALQSIKNQFCCLVTLRVR